MSIPAINLGAGISAAPFQTNQLTEIGNAIGNAPAEIGQATLDRQAVGNKLLEPYREAVNRNPQIAKDPGFQTRANNIAKAYGIPPLWMVPAVGSQTPADGSQPTAQQSATQSPAAQAPTQSAQAPQYQAGAQTLGASRDPRIAQQPMGADYTNEPAQQAAQQTPTGTPTTQPGQAAPKHSATASTAAQPQMQFDAGLFTGAAGKSLSDLSVDEVAAISAQPTPEKKLAYAQALGVQSLPPSVLNAGAMLSGAQQVDVNTRFTTDLLQSVKLGAGPNEVAAWINGQVASGLVPPQVAAAVLQGGALDEIRQNYVNKMADEYNAGRLSYGKYQEAVAKATQAKSLGDLEEAQANLANVKAVVLPKQVNIALARVTTMQENAATNAGKLQLGYAQLKNKNDANGIHLYATALQASKANVDQIQKTLSTYTSILNSTLKTNPRADANDIYPLPGKPQVGPDGNPVMDPTTGQPAITNGPSLAQLIQQMQGQLTKAQADYQQLRNTPPSTNLDASLKTGGVNPAAQTPPFVVPPGYTAEQRGGKWGVTDATGTWYLWAGAK